MRIQSIVSATLCACAGLAAADNPVQLHGYASQGFLSSVGNVYLDDNSKDGVFGFTEVGLNATTSPADRITLGVAISAQDLGRYGNMKLGVDWAYGRYDIPKRLTWLDANVAVGRVKMGYGLYGDQVDLDMTRSAVFLPQVVYSPVLREFFLSADGVQLNASLSAGRLGTFDLSLLTGVNNITSDSVGLNEAFVGPLSADGSVIQTDSAGMKRADMVSLTWNTPCEGLRIKGSVLHGQDGQVSGHGISPVFGAYTFENNLHNYYAFLGGAEYQHGDWTFAGELERQLIRLDTTLDIAAVGTVLTTTYQNINCAYLMTAYRFQPAWEAVVSLSAANTSDQDPTTDDSASWHRGVSVAVRWDVASHFLLKGEFERNHGNGLLSVGDIAKGTDRYWSVYAVKATFDF